MTEKQQQPNESIKGMERRKSRLAPDGSTSAPEREESRHTCTNLIEHNIITLTPSLAQHYTERSQATGKPVQALVLPDLTALHRKRVAREEKRVWKEIEYERL